MLYIIGIVICLFSLICPKRKQITALLFTYLFFVGAFAPDRDGYGLLYLNPEAYSFEYGFYFLMSISKNLGLPYGVFRSIIVITSLILLIKTIRTYTDNINIVLILYILYPFWLDTVELRSAISMSLVLYGLKYLFADERKDIQCAALYCLFVLIAASLHQSMYVFLILVLVRYLDKKMCIFVAIVGFIGFYAINTSAFLPVVNFISRFISVRALKTYVLTQYNIYSFLHLVFWIMLRVVPPMVFLILERQQTADGTIVIENSNIRYKRFDYFFKISVLLIMFLPFEFRKIEFERIYRLVFILLYIGVSDKYMVYRHTFGRVKVSSLLTGLVFTTYMFCAMYYMFVSNTSGSIPYFESVFRPVFENNSILSP